VAVRWAKPARAWVTT